MSLHFFDNLEKTRSQKNIARSLFEKKIKFSNFE